jgi:hypothetical protein
MLESGKPCWLSGSGYSAEKKDDLGDDEDRVKNGNVPVSPVGFPEEELSPGPAGITMLVITAVAPPTARRALGAAVEVPGSRSVSRVIGASPAAGGGGVRSETSPIQEQAVSRTAPSSWDSGNS